MHETTMTVELAARAGAGLEVLLLWNSHSGGLWVDVLHVRSGQSFAVDAAPNNALDVFHHPFAYGMLAAA